MPRRSTPERIADAEREGTRQRLISTAFPSERLDELVAAFEALPEVQGRAWDGEPAYRWVIGRRH